MKSASLEQMMADMNNGTYDLTCNGECTQCGNCCNFLNRNLTGVIPLDGDVRLATYSTEEKAIKAMEMLRELYLLKTEVHSDYNCHHYKVALNKVFQFPQDNEIEV